MCLLGVLEDSRVVRFACPLNPLQWLTFQALAADWSGETQGLEAAQPQSEDGMGLDTMDADTDGLDAAAPYADTSYEDESADSLGIASPEADVVQNAAETADIALTESREEPAAEFIASDDNAESLDNASQETDIQEDAASNIIALEGNSEDSSTNALQPEVEDNIDDGSDSSAGMSEASKVVEPQEEAASTDEKAAEGFSRSNGTSIERTEDSITFRFD